MNHWTLNTLLNVGLCILILWTVYFMKKWMESMRRIDAILYHAIERVEGQNRELQDRVAKLEKELEDD